MLPRRVTKCLQSNTPARVFPFNYYSYLDIARLQCYWVWICDVMKLGVTLSGHQKKIVSSIKQLETQTKNSPVAV
ncbi:ephrin type-A receptor 5-like isoform X2 [Rhincodon typus]|uniref:ephrin type-A receptor 5-like isoform X2 n=1 Tax=Rhincodon typus TaxID=259920 RepID=UPI00202EF8E2|nr:ephrin type-A receptor 5-like isoform X2 [Rhincodon typus]